MLCCDGFRHVIMPEEFYQAFRPDQMTNPDIMRNRIEDLIRLNIQRNEDDKYQRHPCQNILISKGIQNDASSGLRTGWEIQNSE